MCFYTKNSDSEYYEHNKCSTNCASFALNIEEWWDPDFDPDWFIEEGSSEDNIAEIIADYYIEQLLNDFDNLRIVEGGDIIYDNEELIAFRTYVDLEYYEDGTPFVEDYDFHFRVHRNGRWQEKCGGLEVQDCAEDWGKYDSRTYYLAHEI